MKSRRHRTTVCSSEEHPVLFDHDLLRHSYVSGDGVDVVDLTNSTRSTEGKRKMEEALSLFYHSEQYLKKHATNPAFVYLHDTKSPSGKVLRQIESHEPHIWLVQQEEKERTPQSPQGYSFSSPAQLFSFLREQKLRPPGYHSHSKAALFSSSAAVETAPLTKWIDIQTSGDTSILQSILSRFRVDPETEDRCLYHLGQDFIETKNSVFGRHHSGGGFFFLTLVCTQVVTEESIKLWGTVEASPSFTTPTPSPSSRLPDVSSDSICRGKSVMEMRFIALRHNLSRRSALPDPVPVAVIAFNDWVITVHESPFAEMDDLLRMLQLYCGSAEDHIRRFSYWSINCNQRFTTPLFVSSLLSIAVGHNINSVSLAEVVDELGEVAFDAPENKKDEGSIVRRITEVRRCFGECTTDVNRREQIVDTLLDADIENNFFAADQTCKEVLETLRSHLRHSQAELSDCQDTAAVLHWYHNVAAQRVMLIHANRNQRLILLLAELCNVMYSIMLFQTLYSMNVVVPFDSNGNDPSTSYIPFIVTAVFFLAYLCWFGAKSLRLFRQKVFRSQFFGL